MCILSLVTHPDLILENFMLFHNVKYPMDIHGGHIPHIHQTHYQDQQIRLPCYSQKRIIRTNGRYLKHTSDFQRYQNWNIRTMGLI